MTEENFEEMDPQIVEIVGEDGETVKCEVYDVIDFEDKTYAILLPTSDDEASEAIVMEYVEEGEDEAYFQDIQDDEEFKRVCDYIESLEADDEEEE